MELKQVNFICFNKNYPVELQIFNKHSNFFSNEKERKFELLNEFDFNTSHTKESIEVFLNFCQDRPYKIEASNVVSIEALSRKFFVDALQKKAEEFIKNNYKEVIEYFLSTQNSKSPKYEDLLSKNFIEFSDDDRLFDLPISTLYRIEQSFLMKIKTEEFNVKAKQMIYLDQKMINFLIKTVSVYGEDSLLFISSNKFNQEQIKYLKEQIPKIEDEITKEILVKNLQSNINFVIEYHKNVENL